MPKADLKAELLSRLAELDQPELARQAGGELASRIRQASPASSENPATAPEGLPITDPESGRLWARRLPAGSWVVYALHTRDPRRWFTCDRAGHVIEYLDWRPDGTLLRARVRLADRGWLEVRPGAATHALFGAADAIVRHAANERPGPVAITVAGALDWGAIDHLPPVDRPGALPPGGGGAVLALIAGLLVDQGRSAVRYRGPYPTEGLFARLLGAFRPLADDLAEARAVFSASVETIAFGAENAEPAVDFSPFPPERLLLADGTLVHVRDGVEEVFDQGRVYAARDRLSTLWPARDDLLVAGLTFLDEPLEEHLILDQQGDLVARIDDRITADNGFGERGTLLESPFSEGWRQSITALLAADCTPILVQPVVDVLRTVPLLWGETDGRWVEPRGEGWVVHGALPARFRARCASAPGNERLLASLFVTQVAGALRDPILRAAQDRIEAMLAGRSGSPGDAATPEASPSRPPGGSGSGGSRRPSPGASALVGAMTQLIQDLAAGRD
jgi:hypothetical protein